MRPSLSEKHPCCGLLGLAVLLRWRDPRWHQHAVHGCKNYPDIRSDFAVAFAFIVQAGCHHDKPDRQNQADKEAAHRKIDDLKYSKQKHCHRYDRCACFGNHPVQIHLFFLLHIPIFFTTSVLPAEIMKVCTSPVRPFFQTRQNHASRQYVLLLPVPDHIRL